MVLPGLVLLTAVMLWAAPGASAVVPYSMTISSAATTNMTLSGGIYAPTADGANLSVTDLVDALQSGNLVVGDSGQITVDSTINTPTSSNLTFDGAVAIGSDLTIATSTGAITFESTIDGAHALTVNTGGTLDFAGAIGGETPLTSLTVTEGSIPTQINGNVTTTGFQSYGPVTLESDVTFSSASTVDFNNVVTGTHQLTVSGPGIMSLHDSADTYSGGTVVTGGATLVFRTGALGSAGTVTLDGGTLTWGDDSVPVNTDDLSPRLRIGAGGGTLDTNGNNLTFADGFGGSGPLTKTGSGTLTLGAATGTYGDQILVHAGTVDVPASATVGTPVLVQSGGSLNCQDGTLTGGVTNQGGITSGAPAAPTNVIASAAFQAASISFSPGAANCYPISYTATSGALSFGPATGTPITATGLVGGQAYTFTVTATNPIGSSSAYSTTIVPTPFPPTVVIASPVNNATYTQGQVVDTSYTCKDGSGGPGISACVGPVDPGAALNTSTPGQHSFTVTASSSDGYTATATAIYDVVARTGVLPPANHFTVRQLKAHASGSIDVSLASLTGAGTVKVTEQPAGLRAFSVREAAATRSTLKFTVVPSGQLKTWLGHHHGKLAVKLSITYTPRGGRPRTVNRSVTLP